MMRLTGRGFLLFTFISLFQIATVFGQEQVVDAGESSVVADPTEVLADGTSSLTITVTARESDGEPIEDAVVSLDQGDGNSEIDPASATTDINGEAEFTVTNTIAESVTYTATADQESIEQTATVDFTPVAPVAEEADQITGTAFNANWGEVLGAANYRLDVSVQSDFSSFVDGFEDLDVEDAISHRVAGLVPGTEYHYRVRAVASTGTSDNSNVIAVTTQSVDAGNSEVVANPTEVEADGSASAAITVTALGSDSNPVPDVEVTLSQDGNSLIEPSSAKTNSSGDAEFTVTNETPEEVTYTATAGGTEITQTVSVDFVAGAAETLVMVSGDDQSGTVTESLDEPFVVRVLDVNDNPVQGHEVTFSIESTPDDAAGQELSETTTTTNAEGEASTVLTLGNRVGDYDVEVDAGDLTGSPALFTATAEHGAPDHVTLAGPDNVTAGQTSEEFTLTVRDSEGNPAAVSETTSFTLETDQQAESATFTPGSPIQISAGESVVTFTYENEQSGEGTHEITATRESGDVLPGGDSASHELVVEPAAADRLAFDQQPATTTAGVTISPAVTVRIEDEFGNLVSDATDVVSMDIGTNPAGGTLSGTLSVAAVDGIASFEDLSIDNAGEGYTLEATSGELTQAESDSFDITAGDAEVLAVTPLEHEVTAGDRVSFDITRFDANDNEVTQGGLTVDLRTDSNSGDFFTDEDGVDPIDQIDIEDGQSSVTVWYTDTDASVATPYELTFDGGEGELTQTAQITDVIPANAVAISELTADDNVITADGTTTVRATVEDGNGNPVEGVVVSFSSDEPDRATVDPTATTDETGQAEATISGSDSDLGEVVITGSISEADENVDQNDSQTVAIQVTDQVAITTTGLSDWTVEQPGYNATLEADGGTGPYNWSVTGGDLPGGLSLEAGTGEISGIPTASGTFDFTVQVEDDNGFTDTRELEIIIHPLPSITATELPDGVVGDPYEESIAFEGGTAPFSWEITEGVLPDGLGLDEETGQISGTPTLADLFEFTVMLTEAAGASDSQELSIDVSPGDAAALFIAQQPEGGPSGEELQTQPVIEIRDGQGNLVSDDNTTQVSVAINTAESGSGGTLGGSTTITAENGVVTFTNLTFSGLVEEEYIIRFTASGLVSIDSEPITVTHGEASQLVLSGETGDLVSGDPRELTVAIRDAQGNLVNTGPQSELEVNFNQTGGDGSVSGLGEVSASEGVASLEVTGDEAGAVSIRAFTDSPELSSNTLTFDVNPGQADAVAVLTQPQQTVAGQTVEGPPAARVTDDSGNPVGGVAVAVSEEGGASFAAGTLEIATGADGVATFEDLVINQANTYRLVFDASGVSDNAISGEFDVIAANAVQIAQLTSDDEVITTDGTTMVQASVVDEFGNPVVGVTVSFASDIESLATVEPESTTDSGGQASAEVTAAGEESGDVNITASIDAADENVDQSDEQSVSILVTDELTINTTSLPDWTAGQSGYEVQLQASGGVDPLVWSLAGDSGPLPEGLTLEEDGLLHGTPAETGTFTITVEVADDVGATNTRELSITIYPQPEIITEVLPDGVAGDPYEVAIDFEGGTAPFSWEVTEEVLPDGLELDEEGGQISGTPTLADLFEFTVELTDSAGASVSKQLSIDVSPGDPATVLVETLQGTATTDGESELEYLVTVEDALENPVPGVEVHATHDGEEITFTGEGDMQTTDLNGQATFTATSTSAQSVEFTFTEQLFDNAATADGAFSAGDADRLAIAPDQHEVTAGERVLFDITRFDANDNEVTQGELTVDLSSASAAGAFFAGGEGGDPIDQIDIEDGQSSVTVWYTDTDASADTPYELTFDGGSGELTQTAQITAVMPADPAGLALSADPTDPVAGQVTTLTATVTDEFGNPVPGAEADFSIEAGNGSFEGASTGVTTDADGQAMADYITHTTIETADLRAELSGDATIGDEISVNSVPGVPDRVAISEITSPQTAGQAFEVTFTVQDANENTVTGFEGILDLGVEFGGISPATASFDAADEGQKSETLTLDAAGTDQKITASWQDDTNVSGESNEFDVSAGNATQIAQLTTADEVITTDDKTTVEALVVDNEGNPVEGVTVRFASDNESLATVEAESTTDSGGQASAEVTAAGEESGDVIITASIDSADENVDQSDEQSVSILVTDELTITTSTLPDWTANQPDYEVQFQASGGVDPLVWSLAGDSGPPPDGLTLEEDGLLHGTPAETGTFTITVEVADDVDASDARELSFTIHPQPEIITDVLPDGVVGDPYEEAIAFEGGTAPFSWEITEGVLPDGLELDEGTGQISGIPTAVDEFTFTVHISDAAGASDEQPQIITIVTGPPAVVEVETLEGTTPADGSGELSYLVTVEDVFENPVSGVEVVVTHDGEDITFTGDGDTQTTGDDGQVIFTATSTTAQQVTFTFTEQENDNSAEADGTFGDGSGFVVADPGNQTTGEPFHLLISDARGIDGSLLDGQIHVTVTSSLEDDAVHDDPVGFTDGEATVTVILSQAGSHTLTVDVDGVSENQTIDVTAEDPPEIPPAPENLVIESIDAGIRLTWDDPENGVDIREYTVYRGPSPRDLSPVVVILDGTRVYEQAISSTRFFAVTLRNQEGMESGFSNKVSFMITTKEITEEWMMISNTSEDVQSPDSPVQLFSFNGAYSLEEEISGLNGYWINSRSGAELDIEGPGLGSGTLDLNSGWNLIGSLSDTLAVSSIDDPDGILSGAPVWWYDPVEFGYVETDLLEPGRGHWIHASEAGSVELEIERTGQPEAGSMQLASQERGDIESGDGKGSQPEPQRQQEADLERIVFKSGDAEQPFLISQATLSGEDQLWHLLPPKAPDPVLDVRTIHNYRVADRHSEELMLTSRRYPVQVSMDQAGEAGRAYRLVLRDGNDETQILLTVDNPVSIDKEYDSIHLVRADGDERPMAFDLSQNYPNPFNPATSIRYVVPVASEVSLVVYNTLGQRVQTLVNEAHQPGQYTVEFDAGHLASGIYFVRMKAGNFVNAKKMTLIK